MTTNLFRLSKLDIITGIDTKQWKKILICFVVGIALYSVKIAYSEQYSEISINGLGKAETPTASELSPIPNNVLTHEQLVWTYVLEWCESRGKGVRAVNPMDLDGTPSYFWFQFKPSTFKYYAEKYRLLPIVVIRDEADWMNLLADGDLQRAIVERMVNDPRVQWNQEFPGCTAKHGPPPKWVK